MLNAVERERVLLEIDVLLQRLRIAVTEAKGKGIEICLMGVAGFSLANGSTPRAEIVETIEHG